MYVMSGSSDKTVRMWDINMAKMVRVFVGHKGPVRTIAFSPDGKFLASAGDDMRVKIWDLVAAKCITEFKGHTGPVCSLSWSGDSEVLASCGVDATVRIWNIKAVNILSYNYSSSKMSMYMTRCANLLSVHYTPTNSLVCIGTETLSESRVK
uniref:Uncharacterized protein n=2 Tax=Timema TaxID=61471 RepID=A0A7R9P166_9NEOP|nr:unnamed protein product [Timema tahoe]